MDPDQTYPIGAVCSGSTLFASILTSSVMLGNYLLQTTSADDIFRCFFFLGALRVNSHLTRMCSSFYTPYQSLGTHCFWSLFVCICACNLENVIFLTIILFL